MYSKRVKSWRNQEKKLPFRQKRLIKMCLLVLLVLILYKYYDWQTRAEKQRQVTERLHRLINASPVSNQTVTTVHFSPEKHTLVFFHIQKTSGSYFGSRLTHSLTIRDIAVVKEKQIKRKACRTKNLFIMNDKLRRNKLARLYECLNKKERAFLLSWHTTFGWSCGLHPGLSDLRRCVESKSTLFSTDLLYISVLRDPIKRLFFI
jgi:hypothetical protein